MTVNLTEPFTDPIVVAGPATSKGWQPGVVRLRNVTPTSFQIRFQEWDYLDGWHYAELIHWIVVERGVYDLGGGKKLIADSFVTNKTSVLYPKWVSFLEAFSETPVVLTQVQTFNGPDAVTDRICGVYPGGMHFSMQEQESKGGHCNETVGYIAVSRGTTDLLGVPCDVKRTCAVVTHNPYTLTGSQGQCKVRVREEQSKDAETLHWAAEKVGFVSLAGQPPLVADMQTCNGKDPCELRCTLVSALARRALGVESADDQWRAVPYEEAARVPDVEPWEAAGPCTLLVRAERGNGAEIGPVGIAVGETVAETLPLARAYRPGDTVALSAPMSIAEAAGLLAFFHWEVDGEPAELGQATIQVEMTGDREAVAFYVPGD
jgi:hypothetical protein